MGSCAATCFTWDSFSVLLHFARWLSRHFRQIGRCVFGFPVFLRLFAGWSSSSHCNDGVCPHFRDRCFSLELRCLPTRTFCFIRTRFKKQCWNHSRRNFRSLTFQRYGRLPALRPSMSSGKISCTL